MHIKTQPTGRGTEIVVEDFTYKDITLKKGFESDGATVPRILWVAFPPFYPDYKTASMVHDYLCNIDQYHKADRYFHEILIKTRVKKSTRLALVYGVRIWHKIAYRNNNQKRSWLKLYEWLGDCNA